MMSNWRLILAVIPVIACSSESPVEPGQKTPAKVAESALHVEAISALSQSARIGQPLAQSPTIRVTNEKGEPVKGLDVVFQISDGGTIAIPNARTGDDGSATAGPWVLTRIAGPHTVSATVGQLRPVLFTATALANPVTTIVRGGDEQSGLMRGVVPEPLTVRMLDASGNAVPGVRVSAAPSFGSGTLEIATAITNSDGVATLGRWTLGPDAGLNQIALSFLPDAPAFQKLFFTATACDRLEAGKCKFLPPDCSGAGACGEIVFTSNRSGNAEIYSVNRDGSALTRLTNHPAGDISPAWSPDGRRIAFISNRDGRPRLYIMDANGSNLVRHPYDEGWVETPAWSPDGSEIAVSVWGVYPGDRVTVILKADTSPGKLSNLITIPGGMAVPGNQPSWSPDGRRLLMNHSPNDETAVLAVVNSDGTNFTPIVLNVDAILNGAWSPDGKQVAVNFYSAGQVHYGLLADFNSLTSLATGEAFGKLTWSPDGKMLAFSHGRDDARGLSVIATDGKSAPSVVTSDGYDPDWKR